MKFISRCALAQFLLLFAASVGLAQSVAGSIGGRVTDASGAPVPQAAITVVEEATGLPGLETRLNALESRGFGPNQIILLGGLAQVRHYSNQKKAKGLLRNNISI